LYRLAGPRRRNNPATSRLHGDIGELPAAASMPAMQTNLRSPSAQAWLLVAAAVGILAITMGSRSVFGLFISPLNSATGLGIATISFAVAVSQLTWGAAQPLTPDCSPSATARRASSPRAACSAPPAAHADALRRERADARAAARRSPVSPRPSAARRCSSAP
jgi:hypothetical protein